MNIAIEQARRSVLTLVGLGLILFSELSFAVPDCINGTTSIWPTDPIPATIADPDTASVELGLKFQSDVGGFICAIRFYKSTTNTGIHVGTLWSDTGQSLGSVTFTNETASGWQRMDFAAPIEITAGTVYTASYLAPVGQYSVDEGFFATAGVTNGQLTALSEAESGGNGVFQYGPGGFPIDSFNSSNYWVDVVFAEDSGPCSPSSNPIVCENSFPGNPPSEWDVVGAGESSIQGFATEMSVNVGETVQFKIDTPATDYRLDIYRMGFYAGDGARLIATVEPTATLPQDQPLCLTDASGLIDCGNWAESASWTVPVDATTGVYFAKAIREDETVVELASHIFFVVRDDTSTSDMLYQTSDATWQAYNDYGGNSLYTGTGPGAGLSGVGRAFKVSYNRPLVVRGSVNEDSIFNAEYPMIRWLEANGYDVSYFSGVDSDLRGSLIANHNIFLSVGHDEYWSGDQRSNVETARDAGVNLAFFSGNSVFWKTRWENSIDPSATTHRTLVCYKETHEGAKVDPLPDAWTGTWRDPRFSPPADGGRPENELTGLLFGVNGTPTSTGSIIVPEEDGKLRLWRNTPLQNLAPNTEATLPLGTLGFEWDEFVDNGFRPAGTVQFSSTTMANAPVLQDFGSIFGPGTAFHALTLYRDIIGGSLVFAAGTIQWSWGLDANHDRAGTPVSPEMQQATVNLFADMGVQPRTLQPGLVAATASTDTSAPVSIIVNPPAGGTVPLASAITISGTASDSGGLVGGVEVSVDGGLTWSAATGRSNWTYEWTSPAGAATVTILSRATDDSLNTEVPGAGNTVNVVSGSDTTPPTVIAQSPIDGSTNVGRNAVVAATFNEAMNAATINTSTVELRNGAALVAATVSYAGNTATLTPTATLAANTTYTVTVTTGVEDLSGNAMAADATWQFTTGAQASPNCSTGTSTIWPSTETPSVAADEDDSAIELGVKFSSDVDGFICGIRFFKAITNTGTHIGNLWTVGGQLLATAVFTSESNSGWQQVLFANPVAITATTTYIASYHAPVGQYSLDEDYFTGFEQSNGPLQALEDVASGGNGVFLPGAGGFPTNTFRGSNYWVDVVFTGNTGGDTVPPTVSSVNPADGSTDVSTATTVTAVFNEVMEAATVNTTSFELRDPGNALVAASVGLSSTTATLTPNSPLAPNTTYTATIRGGASGVTDLAGNPLAADFSWQFTTAAAGSADCLSGTTTIWPDTTTPTVVADPDTIAIELGVKFNADVDGFVCGVRFYKATTNVGTHVGNLWSGDGTLLATATFVNESASGWQQVNFAAPVAIVANTTYVASYHAPAGQYSVDTGYFEGFQQDNPPLHALDTVTAGGNGVFLPGPGGFPINTFQGSNYWVDVVFTDSQITDVTPPTITSITPTDNATNVAIGSTVSAVFSEALNPATVNATTFELQGPSGPVGATVSSAANTVSLVPNAPLTLNTTYTATLRGGASGVQDLAGNSFAADSSWQFTTGDGAAVLLDANFDTDTNGFAYIDDAFRGTAEPAYADGARVPAGGFSGGGLRVTLGGIDDTNVFGMSGGWQQSFVLAAPTEVTVSLRYNLSQTPHYEFDELSQSLLLVDGVLVGTGGNDFLAELNGDGENGPAMTTGWQLVSIDLGELTAGTHTLVIGGYNSKKTFNNESTDILIDDVLVTTQGGPTPPDTTPPTVSSVNPADTSIDVSPATQVSAVFSEPMESASIDAASFELRDPTTALVPATVTYTGLTATLIPTAPLAANTTYSASIIGGAAGVTDLAANPLAATVTWTFTTAAADTIAPTIISVNPADTSTGVSLATLISADFSEIMDAASIDGATFELRDPVNALVPATVSYSGVTATLAPTSPLAANTTYTATVVGGASGVRDLAGNPLAVDQVWQFTTGTSGTTLFIDANFDTDTNGFAYADDLFRGTAEPDYATGTRLAAGGFTGGGLQVTVGGIDDADIFEMSGGWQQSFVLAAPTDITVTFRYNLSQSPHYEGDELSQVLLSVDGALVGTGGGDFIAEITGDGENGPVQTTGWQLFTVNLGILPAGSHTIAIGAYNSKKTFNNESTEVLIDDVQVSN